MRIDVDDSRQVADERSAAGRRLRLSVAALEIKSYLDWDIAAAVLVASCAALAALLGVVPAIRFILGVPLVLFIPGYALVNALFPARGTLDGLERLALSFGLSLSVIPLIALAIEYSPWRLTLVPMLGGLLITTLAFSALATVRRARLPVEQRFVASIPRPAIPSPRAWDRTTRLAIGLAAVSLLLLGGSGGVILAQRLTGDRMTEFALYNADGKPEFYPRDPSTGQPATVVLEVVNREGHAQRYDLRVAINGQEIARVPDINLADGETWRQPVPLQLPAVDASTPVDFELYREGDPPDAGPYRLLRLFVGVHPSPSTSG